jgi:hypothetical protein
VFEVIATITRGVPPAFDVFFFFPERLGVASAVTTWNHQRRGMEQPTLTPWFHNVSGFFNVQPDLGS